MSGLMDRRTATAEGREEVAAEVSGATPALGRWYVKIGLIALSVLLLTLAFAPVGQFYLAWVGLVPWLVVLYHCKSQKAAFFWSWIAGTAFFTANMWWLWFVSGYGLIALMVYCGIWWAFAGLVIRGVGMVDPTRMTFFARTTPADGHPRAFGARAVLAVVLIPIVWVASEWLRGNLMTGLPWLFLGHTQSPILMMCQVSDVLGAYGVSFWVMMVNAAIALALIHRRQAVRMIPAAATVAIVVLVFLAYGCYRLYQTPECTSAGPTVLVVQPSYPQTNTGEKGASEEERVRFHLDQTNQALAAVKPPEAVDLVAWSETMMPPLNHEYRTLLKISGLDDRVYERLSALAAQHHVGLLVGGAYAAKWTHNSSGRWNATDNRNTAYFFKPDGSMSDAIGERYDKMHLVPFGEFIPFRYSIPILYRFFLKLGPPDMENYYLNDGTDNGLTVFHFKAASSGKEYRFVTPICFEDIDSRICTRMFCPEPGTAGKRADFIVNLTNDGWFRANENDQHLQAAIFRSIENRVPSARSVNSGVSGFIDSTGHVYHTIPARRAGTSVGKLMLDSRLSFYTRFGDLFACVCMAVTAVMAVIAMTSWWRRRPDPR